MVDEDRLHLAERQIINYGAVAILGAGLSAPQLPMTAELQPLLWHTIESSPAALAALRHALGDGDAQTPAKELIGNDPGRAQAAWEQVEADAQALDAFQRGFVSLDAGHEPTPAHYAVARLIRAGLIRYVVSFNWDTALERAYEQTFGVALDAQHGDLLAKPHGDVQHPERPWVLPHHDGVIGDDIQARMRELGADQPLVLLTVGYSGSDPAVVERLLAPAEQRWPVWRVGRSAAGDDALTGTADEVLGMLVDHLALEDAPAGWRWVTFTHQRGIGAALRGYRLGPQDVEVCPPVPNVERLAQRLRDTGFARVRGDSGTGKSLTAFQAARMRNREGWHVMELAEPGVATADVATAFSNTAGPVLAVVDDAQAIDPAVLTDLERSVDATHAVALITTDPQLRPEDVELTATEAVAVLVTLCEDQADAIAPLVALLDDRINDGLTGESLDDRVRTASTSQYPWQFMFVLSGGDRRIGDQLVVLRDHDNADLALGIVAAVQLTSRDAGATLERLHQYSVRVGRPPEWLDQALDELDQRRLLISRGGQLRTPHLRLAQAVLRRITNHPELDSWAPLVDVLRTMLADPDEPTQGKFWLLQTLYTSDILRYRSGLLDPAIVAALVDQCFRAAPGRDRNLAAHLLWHLTFWDRLDDNTANHVAGVLSGWIDDVSSDDVDGISWLLGGLRSANPSAHEQVARSVDPRRVGEALTERGRPEAGEGWDRLIGELSHADETRRSAWNEAFLASVDIATVSAWASDTTLDHIYPMTHLTDRLCELSPHLAATLVTTITPAVAGLLEHDVATAANALTHWAFGTVAWVAARNGQLSDEEADVQDVEDEEQSPPEPEVDLTELSDAVTALFNSVDWARAAASLAGVALRDLHDLDLLTVCLRWVAPDALARFYAAVPIDALDTTTQDHWCDLARIQSLVVALGHADDHEPARSWVMNHLDEIETLPTRVIPIAPEAAVELERRGRSLTVEVSEGLRWGLAAEALEAVAQLDDEAARRILDDSAQDVCGGLALRQGNMVEHLDRFVAVADEISPDWFDRQLGQLNPTQLEQNWVARMAGAPGEQSAVELLLKRASTLHGPIGELARRLTEERPTTASA